MLPPPARCDVVVLRAPSSSAAGSRSGALVLVALLYYRPLKAYVDARGELAQKRAVVQQLEAEKQRLEHRLGVVDVARRRSRARRARSATSGRASTSSSSRASTSGGSASGPA